VGKGKLEGVLVERDDSQKCQRGDFVVLFALAHCRIVSDLLGG
jgi:hypothetical protein